MKTKQRTRMRGNGEGTAPKKRPDGRWEARYTAGHTPDGQQVRKSVYGRTRAECADKLTLALAKTERGAIVLTESGKLTLADQIRVHLERRAPELSPGTVLKLRSYEKIIVAHRVGRQALANLKPAHLEEFYRDLARNYSAATVRHVSVLVKQALKKAVRHELLERNPADVAELPKLRDEKAGYQFEPEELRAVLTEIAGHRLYPLFATVATLGLRHGEVLGLQWRDIDLSRGTLDIRRAVVSRGGTPALSQPKTAASLRTLYVTPELADVLMTHCVALTEERLRPNSDSWVFPSTTGGMLSQHNVRRVWHQALTRAGLPLKARIHDLRGAFLSRLIESGADPRTAADLAGHSDPRMTLRVYAYSRAERRKEALLASAGSILPEFPENVRRGQTVVSEEKVDE